jgi:hypothetical protein
VTCNVVPNVINPPLGNGWNPAHLWLSWGWFMSLGHMCQNPNHLPLGFAKVPIKPNASHPINPILSNNPILYHPILCVTFPTNGHFSFPSVGTGRWQPCPRGPWMAVERTPLRKFSSEVEQLGSAQWPCVKISDHDHIFRRWTLKKWKHGNMYTFTQPYTIDFSHVCQHMHIQTHIYRYIFINIIIIIWWKTSYTRSHMHINRYGIRQHVSRLRWLLGRILTSKGTGETWRDEHGCVSHGNNGFMEWQYKWQCNLW